MRRTSALLFLLMALAGTAAAQDAFKLGGVAYLDYYYVLSNDSTVKGISSEGMNGFTYRRLYLTADYRISDAFSARARLEANDGSSDNIRPFVKDLYLRWQHASGLAITGGVIPTPFFEVSEQAWGYRSLERTPTDLWGLTPTRDIGVRVDGPLGEGSPIRYTLMAGNNNGFRPENDKYKRVYAQIAARPGHLVAAVSGNYAGYGGPSVSERNGMQVSALLAHVTDNLRVGVEAFAGRTNYRADDADPSDLVGGSVFGAVRVAPAWQVVGRVDRAWSDPSAGDRTHTTFALAGLAYQPHRQIRLIPNILYRDPEALAPQWMARFTADVTF